MQSYNPNSKPGDLARNFRENQLGGVISGRKHGTIEECVRKQQIGDRVGFQEQKAEVHLLPYPEGGYCKIKDNRKRLVDYDDSFSRFHQGYYFSKKVKRSCLINKWSLQNPIEFSTFSLMKNIRHKSIVTCENYYEESGQPRIIISWVDGSFSAWLKRDGYKKCFTGSNPSRLLCRIIIDTCKGMEYLFQQEDVLVTSVTLEDLFLRKEEDGDCVKLLISHANCLQSQLDQNIRKAKLWADVKTIFQEICKHSVRKLSIPATMFVDYIGQGSSDSLENFPDIWTPSRRKSFLFSLVADKSSNVRSKLSKIKFAWPRMKDQNLFPLIEELLEYERTKKDPTHYNKFDGYDFLRLCRNVIKHWRKFCDNVHGLKSGYLESGAAFTKSLAQHTDFQYAYSNSNMEMLEGKEGTSK